MHSDKKAWMVGAADHSMSVLLMTAEDIAKKSDVLNSSDTEKLHWCWEGVKCICSAKLKQAQLEAHEAAHAPTSLDDVMRKMKEMEAKLTGNGGNGSSVLAKP